jgi:hypothetical protein
MFNFTSTLIEQDEGQIKYTLTLEVKNYSVSFKVYEHKKSRNTVLHELNGDYVFDSIRVTDFLNRVSLLVPTFDFSQLLLAKSLMKSYLDYYYQVQNEPAY